MEVAGVEIELSGLYKCFEKNQLCGFQAVGFSGILTGIGRSWHRVALFLTGI
jgi:hypothetical protein